MLLARVLATCERHGELEALDFPWDVRATFGTLPTCGIGAHRDPRFSLEFRLVFRGTANLRSHFWNWMFLEDCRNRGMSELLLALWPLVALAPIAGHAFRSSFGAPGDFFPRTCRISVIGGFLRLPEIVGRLS